MDGENVLAALLVVLSVGAFLAFIFGIWLHVPEAIWTGFLCSFAGFVVHAWLTE